MCHALFTGWSGWWLQKQWLPVVWSYGMSGATIHLVNAWKTSAWGTTLIGMGNRTAVNCNHTRGWFQIVLFFQAATSNQCFAEVFLSVKPCQAQCWSCWSSESRQVVAGVVFLVKPKAAPWIEKRSSAPIWEATDWCCWLFDYYDVFCWSMVLSSQPLPQNLVGDSFNFLNSWTIHQFQEIFIDIYRCHQKRHHLNPQTDAVRHNLLPCERATWTATARCRPDVEPTMRSRKLEKIHGYWWGWYKWMAWEWLEWCDEKEWIIWMGWLEYIRRMGIPCMNDLNDYN